MTRLVLLAVVLAVSIACDARLALTIDSQGVALDDARIQLEVYRDDGGGCAALAFLDAPSSAPLSVAVVDAGSLVVPRLGDKLVVAEAATASGAIGRGCVEVGEVTATTSAQLTLEPTTALRDIPTTTPVFGDQAGSVSGVVVDANGVARGGAAVRARVLDGAGQVLVQELLSSDDEGAVTFAPVLRDSGPVIVELVPQQPRDASDRVVLDAWVAAPVEDIVFPVGTDVLPVVLDDGAQFVAAAVVDGAPVLSQLAFDGTQRQARVPGAATSVRLVSVNHHRSLGGADAARDLVWLQTEDRLLVLDLATLAVVDELGLSAVQEIASAVVVGDCEQPAHHGPLLIEHGGAPVIVDLAFDRITLVDADDALTGAARSGCVSDEAGGLVRLVVTGDGVVSLGSGIDSIRTAVVTPAQVDVDDGATVVHIGFRADRTALVVRFDGGSTVMTPHRFANGALAARDADEDAPQRLPATPLLVQQGPLFGGANDVLTLLPAGGPDDAAALYGRSGVAASGVVGICSPRAACETSLVNDVDDDGVLDLLTVAANPEGVRARIVRSR